MINLLTLEPNEWVVNTFEFKNWYELHSRSLELPDKCLYTLKWNNHVMGPHTKESLLMLCEKYLAGIN